MGGIGDSVGTRRLGLTAIDVTALGFGCGPLGGHVGRPVDDATAEATLEAAWEAGVRYFDTAPWYGLGMSEHRVGRMLRGRPRDSFVVSTKVGRVVARPPRPRDYTPKTFWSSALPFDWHFDYRRDAVLRSFEDSLQRMGLNRVDILLVHDLERRAHGSDEATEARMQELDAGGGFAALAELRAQGGSAGSGSGSTRRMPFAHSWNALTSSGVVGRPLHAAGPRRGVESRLAYVRDTRRECCGRGGLQFGDPGHRLGPRGEVQLRCCSSGGH